MRYSTPSYGLKIPVRILLIIVGLVLLAAVAARHFHWGWANSETYSHHGATTAAKGNGGICGTVADVHFDAAAGGQPTFVDLDHPYPDQTLTILIWGGDLKRFNPPPESWQGDRICVSGIVRSYHDRPEIVAYGPGQIRLPSN